MNSDNAKFNWALRAYLFRNLPNCINELKEYWRTLIIGVILITKTIPLKKYIIIIEYV